MYRLLPLSLLIALVAVAPHRQLAAQDPVRPAEVRPEQVQGWAEEADRISRELERLQERSLEEPALRRMNEALGAELQAAMHEADPGLPREMGRIPEMEERARRAERSGNRAAARELTRELREIERRFAAARETALRDEVLARKVRFFQALLRRHMVETSPGAERLLARFRELQSRLSAAADPAARAPLVPPG